MNAPARAKGVPWIDPRAYQGLAGRVVRATAPTTEADPVAVLVSLLAVVGGLIGDRPHVRAGGRSQPARIWPLLVGRTGAGRKGTSYAVVENVVTAFDPSYVERNVRSGLSTGEGLIAALRDGEDGPVDKRLLVVESEFARTLGASRREGNTLSQVLRTMWETGRAQVITRADPLQCSGAHLVVVAHVTPRELRLKLADSDVAGGLVNRFLPCLVERSQLLPYEPEATDLRGLAHDVRRAVSEARQVGLVRRTSEAERLWAEVYEALNTDEDDGPLAEVLARGPAYVLRLALAYALLDERVEIDTEHLLAALALWQYVAASARELFGRLSSSSDLDMLRDFIRQGGSRTRKEIGDLFSRNRKATEIDALIEELAKAGDVTVETEYTGKPGRPTVRAHWTGDPADAVSELLLRHGSNAETTKPRVVA